MIKFLSRLVDPRTSGALDGLMAKLSHQFSNRLVNIERQLDTIEYFSHGSRATYVGNNRVLVKIVVGNANIAYFVEADDLLLSPWFIITGGYETDLTNYFLRELRRDSHCIDVGSNFGYFTCLLARFCPQGKIIGIEADKKIYELARDNVMINGFNGFTTVLNAAASDNDADITLYRRMSRSGNTSMTEPNETFTRSLGEAPAETFVVRGLRVDDLLPQMNGIVDFMKIDVEGAEPLVLEGAKLTIANNKNLNIVMEWSPGQIRGAGFDISEFTSRIEDYGLRIFDISGKTLVPLSASELVNIPYRAGIILKAEK